MTGSTFHDLGYIEMTTGVNEKLVGFVTVRAVSVNDGPILVGQLSPADMRDQATTYLAAAEAAESDAMICRFLVEELGQDVEAAASIVSALRNYRVDNGKAGA